MYKSLLLLCLVVVVCAQKTNVSEVLLHYIFYNIPLPTEATDHKVQKPSTIVPPVSQPLDSEDQPCTTQDDKEGRCVNFYLCDTNNTVVTDGAVIIDIRFPAKKCSYLEVCCKLSNVVTHDTDNTPRPGVPKEGCGWRNPDGVGFKTVGDKDGESKFGEFPWMVAILKNGPKNDANPGQQLNVHVGGGSLIHPAVVLTTAHYVVNTKTLKVRAGEWDTQTAKEIYPHQERDVDSVIVHENFNTKRKNLFYDIALLFLFSPMDTSVPNVGLACLPPPQQHTPRGETCVASGWGKDKFEKDGTYQVILKKVTVPVVEREQCQTQLRETRLGRYFVLHSSFMCAGGEAGVDTCKGDGGSPLMCPIKNEPNRYMQSGMVAWGIGCGGKDIPGVYVDVSNLRDWIDDKIAFKGLDTKAYTI